MSNDKNKPDRSRVLACHYDCGEYTFFFQFSIYHDDIIQNLIDTVPFQLDMESLMTISLKNIDRQRSSLEEYLSRRTMEESFLTRSSGHAQSTTDVILNGSDCNHGRKNLTRQESSVSASSARLGRGKHHLQFPVRMEGAAAEAAPSLESIRDLRVEEEHDDLEDNIEAETSALGDEEEDVYGSLHEDSDEERSNGHVGREELMNAFENRSEDESEPET